MVLTSVSTEMPVVRNLADFPAHSGNWLERLVFNNRRWVMLACLLLSGLMSWFNFMGLCWRVRPQGAWRAGHETLVTVEVRNRKHLADVIRRIRRLGVVHGVQRL